jgi:hypothetical protein
MHRISGREVLAGALLRHPETVYEGARLEFERLWVVRFGRPICFCRAGFARLIGGGS